MATSGIGGGFSNLNLAASAAERAQKLMKQMDTDSDGKVSKQEFAAFGENMKANGPGRAERGGGVQAKGATRATPPSADELFAKADADGNGALQIGELTATLAEHETNAAARGGHHGGPGGAGGPPPGGAGGPPPGGGAGGASGGTTSSKSSSSSAESDPADADHDGKVSAAEKLAYELSQMAVSDTTQS